MLNVSLGLAANAIGSYTPQEDLVLVALGGVAKFVVSHDPVLTYAAWNSAADPIDYNILGWHGGISTELIPPTEISAGKTLFVANSISAGACLLHFQLAVK